MANTYLWRAGAALIALAALYGAACSPGGPDNGNLFVDIPPIAIVDSGEIALTSGAMPATSLQLTEPGSGASVELPGSATVSNLSSFYDLDGNGVPDFIVVTLRPAGAYAVASGNAQRNGTALLPAQFAKVGGVAVLPIGATFNSNVTISIPVSAQATSAQLDVYRWETALGGDAVLETGHDGVWRFDTTATRNGATASFTTQRLGQFVLVDPALGGGGPTPPPGNQLPTATLTADPISGPAPLIVQFDASASTDTDGTIVSYAWDFLGNGDFTAPSADPTTEFTYTAESHNNAAFNAAVLVTDDDGGTDTVSIEIRVGNQPPVITSLTADPANPAVDEDTVFTAVATDPEGGDLRYAWDFDGSGTFTETGESDTITQSFATAGPHQVTVRVTDDAQLVSELTQTIQVGEAVDQGDGPRVNFVLSPEAPVVNEPVTVTVTATTTEDAEIILYEYNFGDVDAFVPATSTETPHIETHTYTTAGTYTMQIRVADNQERTATRPMVVIVTEGTVGGDNVAPVASLVITPGNTGTAPLTVTLDASGSMDDGAITKYEFDLGGSVFVDNELAAQREHTFSEPGTYNVAVRVTDDGDPALTHIAMATITVTEPPVGATHSIAGHVQRFNGPQPGGGSEGINGVLVQLRRTSDDGLVGQVVTTLGPGDFPGYFQFTGVPAGGSYYLRPVDPPSGSDQWEPEQIDIENLSGNLTGRNFFDRNGF